ncbi:hypothetical protein [Variovorax saccharolyticus]|uniref:hypothetical protein n=1 Tax=Variovorax saccharolyticus TaxID=3053516 RepID=UPI0025775B11|nr:hypothetical protein [Variovorax sp. J31P216]
MDDQADRPGVPNTLSLRQLEDNGQWLAVEKAKQGKPMLGGTLPPSASGIVKESSIGFRGTDFTKVRGFMREGRFAEAQQTYEALPRRGCSNETLAALHTLVNINSRTADEELAGKELGSPEVKLLLAVMKYSDGVISSTRRDAILNIVIATELPDNPGMEPEVLQGQRDVLRNKLLDTLKTQTRGWKADDALENTRVVPSRREEHAVQQSLLAKRELQVNLAKFGKDVQSGKLRKDAELDTVMVWNAVSMGLRSQATTPFVMDHRGVVVPNAYWNSKMETHRVWPPMRDHAGEVSQTQDQIEAVPQEPTIFRSKSPSRAGRDASLTQESQEGTSLLLKSPSRAGREAFLTQESQEETPLFQTKSPSRAGREASLTQESQEETPLLQTKSPSRFSPGGKVGLVASESVDDGRSDTTRSGGSGWFDFD